MRKLTSTFKTETEE